MEFNLIDSTNTPSQSDGVSSLEFSSTDPNILISGNWNKQVTLFDVSTNTILLKQSHQAAVLDVCFQSTDSILSASLDKTIKQTQIQTNNATTIGKHDDAVKSVLYSQPLSLVISGSWDKTVRLWDQRTGKEQALIKQPQKVFSMDMSGNMLVVGMSERLVHIYDLRSMQTPVEKRESSLKFMTRVVKCMPSGEGYAMGSIEGRIAVEFFDQAQASQSRKYAFKCHRQIQGDTDKVYPVNSLAYHPIHGTFASGGGDGIVNVWDGLNKKRIKQIGKYDTSIAALDFNCYGNYLAIAASYTFEEGEKEGHPRDVIVIRKIADTDVKPKIVAAA